ncbi:hypothetical protein WA171_000580 [Blastocystis sp. BT1]
MNSESSTLSKLGKTDKTTSTVRTINGKAISGSLLSKLKEQIAEKEKERLELKADREKRKEAMPVKHSVVRKTVTKPVDPSLQESASVSQRDNDTYISLKQALQNRLYDVLLNWNLFCDAQPLPILPPSFHNVEEYIRLYLGFVLQEVQAQAIKSLNPYYSII